MNEINLSVTVSKNRKIPTEIEQISQYYQQSQLPDLNNRLLT